MERGTPKITLPYRSGVIFNGNPAGGEAAPTEDDILDLDGEQYVIYDQGDGYVTVVHGEDLARLVAKRLKGKKHR